MLDIFDLNSNKFTSDIEIKEIHAKETNDIAIIGISVKLPLADNLDEFRDVLKYKIDCIRELPENRKKDIEDYLTCLNVRQNVKFQKGAFLDDIDRFDYDFFKITPTEAKLMNPVQRLVLTSEYEALDDAGYANDTISGTNTGVFVGYIDLDAYHYKEMILKAESNDMIDISVIGNLNSMIPSRIAYLLNLKGPCIMVDTACSSSLVAIHNACNSIRSGDCDQALVSSCRVNILPVADGIKIGMESPHDRVRAFDSGADGTSKGEGVISIFLKPLHKAKKDKDNIYAVIKGSAINHDGTTMGITAPNAQAQCNALVKAWERSGINPENIECFEAHGTATKIGDTIEIDGISKAFSRFTNKKQFCAIGSVKSNIGHLYDAAGLASVIKGVLELRYQELLPTANFTEGNPNIKFEDSPVYINDTFQKWNTALEKRLCAVSSFGFSGTNCHLVLEEYPSDIVPVIEEHYHLLALSSKKSNLLFETVKRYEQFICRNKSINLDDLCYTADVFKTVYEKKLVFLFKDIKQLKEELRRVLAKKEIVTNEIVEPIDADGVPSELKKTAKNFIMGIPVNWDELYSEKGLKKIHVPTHVFDDKRCWIDFENLKKNQSMLEQCYKISWLQNPDEKELQTDSEETVILIHDENSRTEKLIEGFGESRIRCITVASILDGKLNEFDGCFNKSTKIIYMPGYFTKSPSKTDELKKQQYNSTWGLLKLVRYLDKEFQNRHFEIIILSVNGFKVFERDKVYAENAIVHGYGKVISLEYSNFTCRSVDVDELTDAKTLYDEILMRSTNLLVALRNNKRYVQQLETLKARSTNTQKTLWRENATYIITGGLGALGSSIGAYLSKKKGISLAILGRRSMTEEELGNNTNYRIMKQNCKKVKYYSVDISDFTKLEETLSRIRNDLGCIKGVIQAAGVASKGLLSQKTELQIESVISPKIYGTWNMLHLLSGDDLDIFVMFSSGLTMLGEYGQAEYIAANTYLDAICHNKYRNIKRLLTINWPLIANGGMGDDFKYQNAMFDPMPIEKVTSVFESILSFDSSRVVIGKINKHHCSNEILSRLSVKLSDEIRGSLSDGEDSFSNTAEKQPENQNQNIDDTLEEIQSKLLRASNELLGTEELDADSNLMDIGVDSIIFAKLHGRINDIYPNTISISQMFLYPSVNKLALFINDQLKAKKNESNIKKREDEKKTDNANENLLEMINLQQEGKCTLDDILDKIDNM